MCIHGILLKDNDNITCYLKTLLAGILKDILMGHVLPFEVYMMVSFKKIIVKISVIWNMMLWRLIDT
jgi:hypothetical protein